MPQTRLVNKFRLLKRSKNNSLRLLGYALILLAASRDNSTGSSSVSISQINKRIQNKRLKILVVDDDPEFRKGLCFNLRTQYMAVVDAVHSGAAAIETVQTEKGYDLVMLDLRMRGKNGIETYKELVGTVRPDCKFALMSAWPGSEEWDEASKLDVILLQKPIPSEQLRNLLNNCVGGD